MSSAADSSATRISLDPIEAQQLANATIDVKELLVASRDSMLFADPEDRDDPRPEAADFPTHGVAAVRSGSLTLRRIWDELELERQAFVLNQDEDVIVADTGALVDGSEQVFGAWGADDRRSYGAQMDRVQRLADWQERDEQLLDMWERRHGPQVPPPIGPPPVGPPPLPAPPTVPEVSMVFPVVSARF